MAGLTARQAGKLKERQTRLAKYGPSLRSVPHPYPTALIAARRARLLSPTCGKGHRFTAANTLWVDDRRRPGKRKRYCRACLAIGKGRARWARLSRPRVLRRPRRLSFPLPWPYSDVHRIITLDTALTTTAIQQRTRLPRGMTWSVCSRLEREGLVTSRVHQLQTSTRRPDRYIRHRVWQAVA